MHRFFILTIIVLASISSYAQKRESGYFVILPENHIGKTDTIYGSIATPLNMEATRYKIIGANGKKKKYYCTQIKCIKIGDVFYYGVPFGYGRAFPIRIVTGEIELFYFKTGYIYYGGGVIGGILTGIANASNESLYIRFADSSEELIKIPHSKKKMREAIGFMFESNQSCYKKLMSEDFSINQIVDLVKEYNGTLN